MKLTSGLKINTVFPCFLLGLASLVITSPAMAGIEVVEIMYNPDNNVTGDANDNDNIWEWVEIRNTDPNAINLDGYLMAQFEDNFDPNATIGANISITQNPGANLVVPAGGTAILYDAFDFDFPGRNYDPNGFYEAWDLDPNTVQVIPVDFWGFNQLSNSAGSKFQSFAFYAPDPSFNTNGQKVIDRWPTFIADGGNELTDPNGLTTYASAAFSFNFSDSSFPNAPNGSSIVYSGFGTITDGANWAVSTDGGPDGGKTSLEVVEGGPIPPINNSGDVGNPGTFPGSAPTGLAITEIMYDPDSSEDDWEWVEIYNGTGGSINFGADPNDGWVIDDSNSLLVTAPNISGTLPNGEVGILYNADDTTSAEFLAAWDPNGDIGLNLLAVTEWNRLGLNNGGDSVAIWDNYSDLEAEASPGDQANAVVSVDYSAFDKSDGGPSIYLGDASLDPTDPNNWLAAVGNDIGNSFNAVEVFDPNVTVSLYHDGGDIGSPGSFTAFEIGIDGDFNGDGRVDAIDFLEWQRDPNIGDLADWTANYGTPIAAATTAVPEPSTLFLVLGALSSLGLQSRRESQL